MTYTAKTAKQLRQEKGTLLEKIATENALIQAELAESEAGTDIVLADTKILVGSAAGKAAAQTVSGAATLSNSGVLTLAAAQLVGTQAAVVAVDNVIGGIPVVHMIAITAGAVGAKNITLTHKTRVLNVRVLMRGAGVASCTLVVGNAGNAITNAMDVSVADTTLIRCSSLDDTYFEIAAGGSLRVTTAAGASQPDCLVVVEGVRVA